MKIAKWVAGVLIGLAAVAALAVAVLTLLIDPNRFRGQIEAAVRDATGRPFRIQSDLEITWFPWLAVKTGQAELDNPPGVSDTPLAQWETARVGVRLMPLLHGELMVDRIMLDGLKVALKRDANGRTNWEDLLAQKPSGGGSGLRIAGLEIRKGALDYLDERAETHLRLSGWNLDVGSWGTDEPMPVETRFRLEKFAADGAAPNSVELDLRSTIRLAPKKDRVELRDTEVEGTARAPALPGVGVPFAIQLPQVQVAFEPLELTVPDWHIKIAEAQLAGSLTARKQSDSLDAKGPLSVRIPSVRKFLGALGIDAPLPKDSSAFGPLTLKTSWALAAGALSLDSIALRWDETSFTGALARSAATEPTWTFDLHGDRIDLGRYLVTEDNSPEPFELPVKALKSLRAQGTLWFDRARLADAELKNARLRVLMAEGRVQTDSPAATRGKRP